MKYFISGSFILIFLFFNSAFSQQHVVYSPATANNIKSDVYGVFEGKTPCVEIAREMNIPPPQGCIKLKWRLTLYQDSTSLKPAAFLLDGSFFRVNKRTGNWKIIKGSATDPQAIIFQLDLGENNGKLHLLKGDENVLFLMDRQLNLMVGNESFSYTLNRIRK